MPCKLMGLRFSLILFALFVQLPALAASPLSVDEHGNRLLGPRTIPIPPTVSPEAQHYLKSNRPGEQGKQDGKYQKAVMPGSVAEWKQLIALREQFFQRINQAILERHPMHVRKSEVAGVKVAIVTPPTITANNAYRVLINVHGGAYVFGRGSIAEAVPVADLMKIKVIAVDYRMPPDHPFPAAVDDTVAVYREVLKTHPAENIGIYGTSAGGGLSAAATLKIRDLGLPMPGAVGMLTPEIDMTEVGDTFATNRYIDHILPEPIPETIALYANGHNLRDPYLSPIYADFSKGFPPAFLLSGTRDLFLSNTVRMHRALRKAGLTADLHVFEAMPHAFNGDTSMPEGMEATQELIRFFDTQLKNVKPEE